MGDVCRVVRVKVNVWNVDKNAPRLLSECLDAFVCLFCLGVREGGVEGGLGRNSTE